jgi:hypothetical protein
LEGDFCGEGDEGEFNLGGCRWRRGNGREWGKNDERKIVGNKKWGWGKSRGGSGFEKF